MNKKINIINNVIVYTVTLVLFVLVTLFGQKRTDNFWSLILLMVVGALVTIFHELGHLIAGKYNNFAFISLNILIFKWAKINDKIKFSFCFSGDQAGWTELVAKTTDNLDKRYKKVCLSGIFATIIPTLCGIIPIFLPQLPLWLYSIWVMLLPVGAYSILDNGLSLSPNGIRNDGAVAYGIAKKDSSVKVMLNIMSIHSYMYQGNSPAEIDKNLYFDLPQLREDDLNFFLLLNERYNYYLDNKDYENAKKTTERMLSLEEYFSNEYIDVAKINALYNACTFDYDEDKADDLMYELEKVLNSDTNPTKIRVKLAYILFVTGETHLLEDFYKKGVKEALKSQIKGYGKFEISLLDQMKDKIME